MTEALAGAPVRARSWSTTARPTDTPAKLAALAADDNRIKTVLLSRNFGHQAALTAGLDHASGNVAVTLDSDLQDPPSLIPTLLERWRAGADVVYAVRRQSRRRIALQARHVPPVLPAVPLAGFGRASKPNSGDFRLLDRRALDALLSMRERSRFLRGMSIWVGFTQDSVALRP